MQQHTDHKASHKHARKTETLLRINVETQTFFAYKLTIN